MSLPAELLRQNGVRLAYLFGSRARNEAREDSDYDLALYFEPMPALERLDRLTALEPGLRSFVGSPLDLVILNDAGPLLAREATIRGRLLFGDPEDAFRLEQRIRARYEDLESSQRFFTEARRQRLGLMG
ncbi:MAG: hypothetical protein AMXMBFR33_34210 [Candidatus Xenobia bacterium]